MKFLKRHKNKTYRKEKFNKEQFRNRKNFQRHNFSKQDIRGIDFSGDSGNKYDFTNANFQDVTAGISPRWEKFLKCATFVLSFLAGLTIGYSGAMIAHIDTNSPKEIQFFVINLILNGVILVIFSYITLVRGWGKTLTTLAEIVTGSLFLATLLITVIAFAPENDTGDNITVIAVFSFLSSIGIIAGVFNIAICLNFAHILSIRNPTRFIKITTSIGAFFGIIFGVRGKYAEMSYTLASIIALVFIGLGIHVGSQARKSKKYQKYWLIRWLTTTIARVKATKFNGAILTGADFTEATLSYTDFTNADLRNTCWKDAKGLEFTLRNTTYCHKNLHLHLNRELLPNDTIIPTTADQAIEKLRQKFCFQVLESELINDKEIRIYVLIQEDIDLENVLEKFQVIYKEIYLKHTSSSSDINLNQKGETNTKQNTATPKTSSSPSGVVQHFHGPVYGAAGNVEGNSQVNPNPAKTEIDKTSNS